MKSARFQKKINELGFEKPSRKPALEKRLINSSMKVNQKTGLRKKALRKIFMEALRKKFRL
jgi:hypothetical protein